MSQLLKVGSEIIDENSGSCIKIKDFLGGGGQGEVYCAEINGRSVALKWYFPDTATEDQKEALNVLISKGPPSNIFLWPEALITSSSCRAYGYVMPLRGPKYNDLMALMRRRIEPSFKVIAITCRNLAESMRELHLQGLCYRDISWGNVFFNPDNGEVLICDNDNVAIDGTPLVGVVGTPKFMAPEIVVGKSRPNALTDLYSLAVLLFYMIVIHHPLEGKKESDIKCMDLPALKKIFGLEPVFIFDPIDDSNRPVQGYHDNALLIWPILPQFIRKLFTISFTKGLHDPNARIREGQWREAMVRLHDSIIYCQYCGVEIFYDRNALASINDTLQCWNCYKTVKLPYRIRISDSIVMLNHDSILFPHHIMLDKRWDFSRAAAQVIEHPNKPGVWGLKNLSEKVWFVSHSGGQPKEVVPGRSLSLADGTHINFGNVEGEIRF